MAASGCTCSSTAVHSLLGVDKITNWRDFRIKGRAIDNRKLEGELILDLSTYADRASVGLHFDSGGNDKVLTVPAAHPLASRLRVTSSGDWEMQAKMINKMDPLLRRDAFERRNTIKKTSSLPPGPLSGTDTQPQKVERSEPETFQNWYYKGNNEGGADYEIEQDKAEAEKAWSTAKYLGRDEWECMAHRVQGVVDTGHNIPCPPSGCDLACVFAFLGVRLAVGDTVIDTDSSNRSRAKRRKRHHIRKLLPSHATVLWKGRVLEYDGNKKVVTFESRSHYYTFYYWTS